MATFKDIAEAAGVSYGTVSNVLNGRGNVTSEKIQRVHEAAVRLGYTPNQGAQLLRKGNSNLLAVVVPNISDRQYADFYISFRNYAETMGYRTQLYLHDSSTKREEALAVNLRSALAAGVAVISTLNGKTDPYQQTGFQPHEVVFAEQRPFKTYDYVGFDYRKIGHEMGVCARNYRHVALLTEAAGNYVTKELTQGFMEEAEKSAACEISHYEKESAIRSAALSLDIFSSTPTLEAIFSVILNHASTLRSIHHNFFEDQKLDIYTVSPLFTLPENDFRKYELNYRLLGRKCAEQLISRISTKEQAKPFEPQEIILPNTGFRNWNPGPAPSEGSLTMMTLDGPTANIVKNMARMYTKHTGVPVKVAVFPYDGVHEILTSMNEHTPFDIIRLDATWMSYFANRIFEPLDHLDPNVRQLENTFLPDLLTRYGGLSDTIYALPETPSAQMLFYRKDLFEDTVIRRLYQEHTHCVLQPPTTFVEYNRIARFFTRKYNPESPVEFGSTLTLGNTGVAATEFLTRYFALTHDLFDDQDRILLTSPEAVQALSELVEIANYASPTINPWWRDTARTFAKGEAAMTVLYSNYASEMTGIISRIRGNIGFAIVPGDNPLYGGGSIGVCRYSKQKELAYHFIKWLCSENVSAAMTLLGSVSPCKETYSNYQVIDNYPWLSMTEKCFEITDAHRFPKSITSGFDERRFLAILGTQVINAINGSCSVEKALENAAYLYNQSMR